MNKMTITAQVSTKKNAGERKEENLDYMLTGSVKGKDSVAYDKGSDIMWNGIGVSAKSGEGMEQFVDLVEEFFGGEMPCDGSILTNARQFDAIRRAKEALDSALKGLRMGFTPDAVLTDVEIAMEAMGEVTGATVREDITARIFERFCVGK